MDSQIARWLGHRDPHSMRAAYGRHRAETGWADELRDRADLGASRRALARRLDAIAVTVRAGELAAYRAHLGEIVATVSPLLLRLCGGEGFDLDELVAMLEPRGAWPCWLCGVRPDRRSVRRETISGRRPIVARPGDREFDLFAHGGFVVRDRGGPGTPFGLRVLDCGLEMGAFLGDARLRTHGRTGSLDLRSQLPATVIAALPGRPLDHVVGSWLLAGAGCVVERVEEAGRWGTRIVFSLEPVPWRAPWVRGGRPADAAEPATVGS